MRRKGYRILVIGDMNGHIGCDDSVGIAGNKPGINPNGNLLLEFERYTDMQILTGAVLACGLGKGMVILQ